MQCGEDVSACQRWLQLCCGRTVQVLDRMSVGRQTLVAAASSRAKINHAGGGGSEWARGRSVLSAAHGQLGRRTGDRQHAGAPQLAVVAQSLQLIKHLVLMVNHAGTLSNSTVQKEGGCGQRGGRQGRGGYTAMEPLLRTPNQPTLSGSRPHPSHASVPADSDEASEATEALSSSSTDCMSARPEAPGAVDAARAALAA